MTGEKGGGLISLSAKKAGGLKAFYTLRTTTFCPNKGDRLNTSVPLRVNHEYLLTTKFRIRRDLKPFSAVFVVAYCNKKSKIYINIYSSGGYFKKSSISPEDRKILDTLLKGMEEF